MRYIAFLRAINVGGHTVTMDRLRALLEEIGLRNVSTFIASGNVLFESSLPAEELERKMAEHLERSLGYEVRVFLRTPDELRSVLERLPFSEAEARDGKVHVCFLPEAPGPQAASEVAALSTSLHRLQVRGRELYWLAFGSMARTDVDERALGRVLGMSMTMRNLNTVRRILARLEADRTPAKDA